MRSIVTKVVRGSLFALPLVVFLPSLQGCVATNSDLGTAGGGCSEFSQATIDANLKVDAKVKVFMQASADFRAIGAKVKVDVKKACVNIATDLGAADTWTALGDTDDSIGNANGTGACDAAGVRIDTIMKASVTANFALITVPGACHTDFQAQVACDAQCKAEATCDSGTAETRCQPGQLSTTCVDKCKEQSFCEGSVTVEANCQGSCESTCTGECKGTCTASDGTKTDNNPSCKGKCSSTCNGTCKGKCKVEVAGGIACGTSCKCKGECTTTHTDPVCETTFTAPTCKVDASCSESCTASVAAKAVCDPPHVELYANATVNADVPKLVATINANLPAIVACAEAQGKLAVDVVGKLVITGNAIIQSSGSLDGKSIACGAAAAKAAAEASASLSVSVSASTNVTGKCRGNAS
jgi:hypothetical protein